MQKQSFTSTLLLEDLHLVLSRLPKDICKLLRATPGLILGGGFIRSTITGEPISDIDLFGSSKAELQGIATKFALSRTARFHETNNAFTVLSQGRHAVQFIHRWTYTDQKKLIEDFDFTIAQAAVWFDPTLEIGGQWCSVISDYYYADLASKRLRYLSPMRAEDAGGSLLRARKFLKRGYHIEANSFAKVMARTCSGVRQVSDAIDEERLGVILTGLLREVDPLTVIDGLDLTDEHQKLVDIGKSETAA